MYIHLLILQERIKNAGNNDILMQMGNAVTAKNKGREKCMKCGKNPLAGSTVKRPSSLTKSYCICTTTPAPVNET